MNPHGILDYRYVFKNIGHIQYNMFCPGAYKYLYTNDMVTCI